MRNKSDRAERNITFAKQLTKLIKFLQPINPKGADKLQKMKGEAMATALKLKAQGSY